MKTLDIIVTHYNEPWETCKPLFDSIAVQDNVSFDNIKVILVNDGDSVVFPESNWSHYPYAVNYIVAEHGGVSNARNVGIDASTADYIMICDCDDGLCDTCGLWLVTREMEQGFDSLCTQFREETRNPVNGEIVYINHLQQPDIFVHGKIFNKAFIDKHGLRFKKGLNIHEEAYFIIPATSIGQNNKLCQVPFYAWRWNQNSICRRDKDYMLQTYDCMLATQDALIDLLLEKQRPEQAQQTAVSAIYDAYETLETPEWGKDENKHHKERVQNRAYEFVKKFRYLYESAPNEMKQAVAAGIRQRKHMAEGLLFEGRTFKEFWTEATAK